MAGWIGSPGVTYADGTGVKEFGGIADLFAELKRNFGGSSTFVDWAASSTEDAFVQAPPQQNS
jgi:hypothetical protein